MEARARSTDGVRVEMLRIKGESDAEARVSVEVRLTARGAETYVWRLARGADGKWQLVERIQ